MQALKEVVQSGKWIRLGMKAKAEKLIVFSVESFAFRPLPGRNNRDRQDSRRHQFYYGTFISQGCRLDRKSRRTNWPSHWDNRSQSKSRSVGIKAAKEYDSFIKN